uniref:Condensation domain-containing protein n=1 Tax=Anopheles maculatus TaxID=74869 RepID=A0A182SM39_9DIPT
MLNKTEIDLETNPIRIFLYNLGAEKYLLHIQYHHICMDGWSLGLLLSKLWGYYDRPDTIGMQPEFDYERYVQHLNVVKQSEDSQAYWRSTVCLEAVMSLPTQKNAGHRTLNCIEHQLGSELMRKLERYCKKNGFTLAHAIYAAWSILLAKYNDAGDICFGTTVSGRDVGFAGDIEESIGLYIQTPPLYVNGLTGEDTVADVLQKIKDATLARESHKAYPLADIQAIHRIRHPLFDSIVVIENYPLAKRLSELSTHVDITNSSIEEKTNFDLCLEVNLLEAALLRLSYNMGKYPHYVIANGLKHIEQVLDTIANHDQQTLSRLCLLGEQDYQRLVVDFNHRPPTSFRHTHLIDAWREAVVRHHDAVALSQQARQ